MKEIRIHNDVLAYLSELFDILIEKGYFSFYETSAQYIDDLANFIRENIHITPHKKAPFFFTRYGSNLFYITYQRNKQTSWYIFFEEAHQYYLIRHITNNHVSGHHFS